jgi:hypothetical protein
MSDLKQQLQALRAELFELQDQSVSCGDAGEAPRAIEQTNAKIQRLTEILIALLFELEGSE